MVRVLLTIGDDYGLDDVSVPVPRIILFKSGFTAFPSYNVAVTFSNRGVRGYFSSLSCTFSILSTS